MVRSLEGSYHEQRGGVIPGPHTIVISGVKLSPNVQMLVSRWLAGFGWSNGVMLSLLDRFGWNPESA